MCNTFEVKPSDAIDVTAVYEVLAHLRSATHAYVIFHVPDDAEEAVCRRSRRLVTSPAAMA